MNPGSIIQWVPVAREIVDLVLHIRDNVRKRRAKRKAARKG